MTWDGSQAVAMAEVRKGNKKTLSLFSCEEEITCVTGDKKKELLRFFHFSSKEEEEMDDVVWEGRFFFIRSAVSLQRKRTRHARHKDMSGVNACSEKCKPIVRTASNHTEVRRYPVKVQIVFS